VDKSRQTERLIMIDKCKLCGCNDTGPPDMEIFKVVRKIDWTLLTEQKIRLIEEASGNPWMDGLVNLIDSLQDAVVADGLVEENEVFPIDAEICPQEGV